MWPFRQHSVLIVSEARPDPTIQSAFLLQPSIRLLTAPHEGALEAAWRERPKLIIADLRAPEPEAFESCRMLRADDRTRSIPLILVGAPRIRENLGYEPEALVCEPVIQREYFEAVRRFVPLPKRRETRHPVNLRFTFHHGERRGQAFSRDLSIDGTLLNANLSIPCGSPLALAFRLPGQEEEIRCSGVIVRKTDAAANPQTAVIFDAMGENDRRRLDQFLASTAAR